jgi:hypothetical protein
MLAPTSLSSFWLVRILKASSHAHQIAEYYCLLVLLLGAGVGEAGVGVVLLGSGVGEAGCSVAILLIWVLAWTGAKAAALSNKGFASAVLPCCFKAIAFAKTGRKSCLLVLIN